MIAEEIRTLLLESAERFRKKGAQVGEISLPSPMRALAAYSVLTAAEAASELGRYDGIRYGFAGAGEDLENRYVSSRGESFGREVKRRILFGTYVMTGSRREEIYNQARRVRGDVKASMEKILTEYDLILAPATPTVAFAAGAQRSPAEMYCSDLCTVCGSLAGLPSLSVPMEKNMEGLPMAVQLTAAPFSESLLYHATALLEVSHESSGI
jgi:aspartyl-tRNA(Asn)/glutamyl-tRNA(Gln) amidotransferase subunit A